MTLITVCDHGFPKPANCTDCMAEGPVVPPTPPRPPAPTPTGVTAVAIWSGRCSGCREFVSPGDEIAHMSDGSWRHADVECTEV